MIPIVLTPTAEFKPAAPRENICLPETKAQFQELLKRAEKGEKDAQYLAACTYRAQAEELMDMLEALPSGSPYLRAPYNIGERNPLSDGAQEYYRLAFAWFEKAAAQGSLDALYAVSQCYMRGEGTASHLEKGRKLLVETAEKGFFPAQFDLAMLYYQGYGNKAGDTETIGYVAQDFEKAVYWLQKAAAQGDAMALYFLGKCCEEGTGAETSEELAFGFYRRAAEMENPWAQCALGRCYERGIGTKKDLQRAREYYCLAAETGDEEAIEALERLHN